MSIKVLDKGFVRLVDRMGNDSSIVQAARVSYGKGTTKPSGDRTLIRYLLRNWHTTPFEMVEFKFHIKIPMDCWRQYIRHRTASVNEYSTRYSEAIDDTFVADKWRAQSTANKQGSESGCIEYPNPSWKAVCDCGPETYLSRREKRLHRHVREVYEERLEFGVAREQARKDLTLSNYTEAYWKIDLHNLMHFLRLRLHPHAQEEIRAYAKAIFHILKREVPVTMEAFEDYRLNAITLSGPEIDYIRSLVTNEVVPGQVVKQMSTREKAELTTKLQQLGIV